MSKRLYRKENDRVLGGVCSGLGEYIGIDPLFLRIFFVLWTIMGELSVLAYLILWVIIPREGSTEAFRSEDLGIRIRQMGQEIGMVFHEPSRQLVIYAGVGLIGWGVYYLLQRLGLTWFPFEYSWYIWPVILILAGAFVLYKSLAGRK
jgi:phage shock protein C